MVRLAPLPYLQADELWELHLAITERIERLGGWQAQASKSVAILMSLDTAVEEARYSIERRPQAPSGGGQPDRVEGSPT